MKKKINWDMMSVVATFFVGFMGAFIAWQANRIGDLQAQVAVNSSLPNIQIDERQMYDEDAGRVVASTIEISNLEGKLSNFDASVITVANYTYSGMGEGYYCVDVPIKSYYFATAVSGVNNGVIEKKESLDNFLKIWNLRNEISALNISGDVTRILDPVESYIKISYKDLLGNDRVEYYYSNIINTYRLDEKEGEEAFLLYKNLIDAGYYMDPNRADEIDVEEFCDLAYRISKLDLGLLSKNISISHEEEGDKMTWDIIDIVGVVIALLSFFVAVRAMRLQHKSIVFNNRLEVYAEIEKIYKNCTNIIQKSKIMKNVQQKKGFIASCMYGMNDKEYSVVTDAIEREGKSKKKKGKEKELLQEEWERLLETYADLYIEKYLYNDIESRISLFFSKKVAQTVMKVYKCYDDLRLGIILLEEDELNAKVESLRECIEEFEKCRILKKMKRELPLR